jgi:hypothetical protein
MSFLGSLMKATPNLLLYNYQLFKWMLWRQKQLLTYMNLNLTNWIDLLKRHLNPTPPPLLPRLSRKTEPPISKFLRLCDNPNFPPLCPLEVPNPDPSNFQLPRLWLIPRLVRTAHFWNYSHQIRWQPKDRKAKEFTSLWEHDNQRV